MPAVTFWTGSENVAVSVGVSDTELVGSTVRTVGGTESKVKVRVADVASTLLAPSSTCTRQYHVPSVDLGRR